MCMHVEQIRLAGMGCASKCKIIVILFLYIEHKNITCKQL